MDAQDESGPQLYQIRIRGRLGQTIRSAFPALQARADGGDTVLTGVLADQAALSGVLAEAEALGLELIEFRRLPRDPLAEDRSTGGEGESPPVRCAAARPVGRRVRGGARWARRLMAWWRCGPSAAW